MSVVTARDIVELLRQKHSKDVFVTECKDGPSQQAGTHLRMDVWAMARSWANPLVSAYEVKVSRGDFLGDDKWPAYLDYCNQFSFVCPSGMIIPEEVPDQVGLLYVAKTGTRLFTKRKPAYRQVEIPESLYRYILMCRTSVVASRYGTVPLEEEPADAFWRRWLERRELNGALGARVSKTLAETIRTEVEAVRGENERLKKLVSEYEDVRTTLERLGFKPERPPHAFTLEDRIKDAQRVISRYQIGQMRAASKDLHELSDALEKINNGSGAAHD